MEIPITNGPDQYIQNGHINRDSYIRTMADEFGLTTDYVYAISELIGPDEDFNYLQAIIHDLYYYGRGIYLG